MSEAYLVSGCLLPGESPLLDVIDAICVSSGIKPQHLDEIHLYTDAASALFKRKQTTKAGPVFTWPLLPLLPAAGLRSLCQSLEDGEISICLLLEISARESGALLLANPNAVGRFNLAPLVHLANRMSHPEGFDSLLTTVLKTLALSPAEIEPEEPVVDLRLPKPPPSQPWLAMQSAEIISDMDWPGNRLLMDPSLYGSLMRLAAEMNKTKSARGVWMSVASDGPVLSTLVLHL
jgi:hypothetical protein